MSEVLSHPSVLPGDVLMPESTVLAGLSLSYTQEQKLKTSTTDRCKS